MGYRSIFIILSIIVEGERITLSERMEGKVRLDPPLSLELIP